MFSLKKMNRLHAPFAKSLYIGQILYCKDSQCHWCAKVSAFYFEKRVF